MKPHPTMTRIGPEDALFRHPIDETADTPPTWALVENGLGHYFLWNGEAVYPIDTTLGNRLADEARALERATHQLTIRVTPSLRSSLEGAAAERGITITDFARSVLTQACAGGAR